jgi:hypothetical protein
VVAPLHKRNARQNGCNRPWQNCIGIFGEDGGRGKGRHVRDDALRRQLILPASAPQPGRSTGIAPSSFIVMARLLWIEPSAERGIFRVSVGVAHLSPLVAGYCATLSPSRKGRRKSDDAAAGLS